MKGAARVAWLLFTALPVQRWLLLSGAALSVGCYLLAPGLRELAVVGVIIGFLPTVFACGVLLRNLLAPRVMHLVPQARPQILAGMLLVMAVIAGAFTLVAWGIDPRADVVLVWLRVAAVASLLMTTQLVLMDSAAGTGVWFAVLLTVALGSSYTRSLAGWIGHSLPLLVAVLALTWSAFAAWMRRAQPLRPASLVNIFGWGANRGPVNPRGAVRAFLFGTPALRAHFLGGFALAAVIIGSWGLLGWNYQEVHSLGELLMHGAWAALGIGPYAGINGWLVARRSKHLWLHGGDRRQLFRLCERQAWSSFLAVVSCALLLVPLVWSITDNGREYADLMLFQLCTGVCVLYLGLMRVRGWRLLDVACAMLLLFAWGIVSGSASQWAGRPLMAASALMLAAAFAFRLIALHRWRRIDWLVCRPPPSASRRQLNPA